MSAVPSKFLERLRPYFEAGHVSTDGEVGMHCPLHRDRSRSSSLNVDTGLWYCQKCGIGMSAQELVEIIDKEPDRIHPAFGKGPRRFDPTDRRGSNSEVLPDEGSIAGWVSALMSERALLKKFQRARGLSMQTLKSYEIGWDRQTKAFTIPIRDKGGDLVNVRRYQMDVVEGRRKIWSVKGHGEPALYPLSVLEDDPDSIIICEGEWDALLLNQHGFPAITRTGTADTWRTGWNSLFRGKTVYLCHDMDDKGQKANKQLVQELKAMASAIGIVQLPYEITEAHGSDVTDYLHIDGCTPDEFAVLMEHAIPQAPTEPGTINVLDSFSSDLAGKTAKLRVTITGKRNPPYLLPKKMELLCGMDAGNKCQFCPMLAAGGSFDYEIAENDPVVLQMINSTSSQVLDAIRDQLKIQRCTRLSYEAEEHMSVEELYVRPAVDQFSHDPASGDYTNRKIVSVGRHDSTPNNTVAITGAIHPNPKSQHNEFQAWEVTKSETSIDSYHLTDIGVELMKVFQSKLPLNKAKHIARDNARHVTKIYGRPSMHLLMDLVWHSVLAFEFDGQFQAKGWLEALILGDTRTGKSEAAQKMLNFLQAGDMVSCESATFAGVVGGLQQMGNREWEITWGAIPINDRRLVVLDEVSGMTTEQIAQMSSIRSSGVAELTKIRSEKTYARTRLLWLGNPRDGGRMANFTHGVQAVKNLIGNMEDIARFDLAMSVAADEVESTHINAKRDPTTNRRHAYPQAAARELIQWVWSRKPEHIVWEPGAEELVYELAVEMGNRYVETPPLIQAANVRFKIARVAVALAARTFSTDEGYERVIVTARHVVDAVSFMDEIYGLEGFGYAALSREHIKDARDAVSRWEEARDFLKDKPDLIKFLRACEGRFRNNDLQDMLNIDREMANAYVGYLWGHRLVTRQAGNVLINPVLNQLLREIMKEYDQDD